MAAKLKKTDEEWREELSPDRYHVLREKGTEPPFTGAYTHSKENGMYRCGACGNELFSSDAKFDSGTGWPSFTEPAVAGRGRAARGQQPLHDAHRGPLRPLRLAPGPRLPGRARARAASASASTRCRWTSTSHRTRGLTPPDPR